MKMLTPSGNSIVSRRVIYNAHRGLHYGIDLAGAAIRFGAIPVRSLRG